MNSIDYFAGQWLDWIVMVSWQLALFVGLVTLACWALRKGSARLRHALWLLVLVKVFVSPALTASWSLGNVTAVTSLQERLATPLAKPLVRAQEEISVVPGLEESLPIFGAKVVQHGPLATPSVHAWIAFAWLTGAITFMAVIIGRYFYLVRRMTTGKRLDEGPVRVILEQLAMELKLRQIPEIYGTTECSSPFLLGILRPKIIMPQSICDELDADQLRTILLHELIHHKHHDLWVGWVQIVAQALFWFHPLMWWANQKIRHERECVCDEAVLRFGQCTPESYGETIVQVLTAARGRSLVTGNMVGVFERGNHLQNRMEEIMSYTANKKRFGWLSRAVVLLFAALFLPMAPQAGVSEEVATGSAVAEAPTAPSQGRWPRVIATSPEIGATGVTTSVKEITVTFDRDMRTGMSWTGGPPQFPPADESRKAQWKDKRTCVLPVKLARGKIYRVGINSTSFNNFKSEDGQPALHTALFFTTEGASRSVERQVQVPQIVELEPANHAGDVDPKTRTLRVTFDMPMGGGMSWTGGGSDFPKVDASRKSRWSKNGRTCLLPVTLEPGRTYKLGLNSLHHINFQSKWGVPLVPVVYEFTTSGPKIATGYQRLPAIWTPPENPDPEAIRKKVKDDIKAKRYRLALEKYVWYYENATRLNPSLTGVRVSFAMSDWLELGDVYPPAIEKIKQIRDATEKRIRDPSRVRVSTEDFGDFTYLNQALREEQRTVEVFEWLDETEPQDAKRVLPYAGGPLVRQKAYELYGKYLASEESVEQLKFIYSLDKRIDKGKYSESTRRSIQTSLERSFRNKAATLVAVLVQIDRKDKAMEIAKELEGFLEDAELKEKMHRQLKPALRGEFPKSR